MRRGLTLAALGGLWLALLAPGPAWPQTRDPIRDALDRVAELYHQKKFDEAELFAEEALSLSEEYYGEEHPTTAVMLNNLGELYREQKKYADAEAMHRRALGIRALKLGPESRAAGESMFNLGVVNQALGRAELAEQLYLRCRPILEATLGPNNPVLAIVYTQMAGFYRAQGRLAEAEPLERSAAAILAKVPRRGT